LPDFWTHIFAGQEIIKDSKHDFLQTNIEQEKIAFNFGCQGPDFLFYNFSNPWHGPILAKKLHKRKPNQTFSQLVKYGNNCSSQTLRAYLLGYLTHFMVDKELHPFVLARSPNFSIHKRLENEIDSLLIEHYLKINPKEVDTWQQVAFKSGIPEDIIAFFTDFIAENYEIFNGQKALINSYNNFKMLQNLLNGSGKASRVFWKAANLIIPFELTNLVYGEGPNMLWPEEKNIFFQYFASTTFKGSQIIDFIGDYWLGKKKEKSLDLFLQNQDFSEPKEKEILATLPA